MNDHPRELLPLIAEGAVPPAEVRLHLDSCSSCAAALESLSPIDLRYAWQGILGELDAPKPGMLERVLVRAGLDDSLARFVAYTPSLRGEWILSSVGVVALAVVGMLTAPDNQLSLVMLVAPLVAAALVSFAYGPVSDPAYEIVAATPLSPLMALLLRLAAVLSVNAVFVFVGDLVTGGPSGSFAWFLPMTFVALFAAAVALKSSPFVGAGAGALLWSAGVFSTVSLFDDPASALWGPAAQTLYGVGSGFLLLLLMSIGARGTGFITESRFRRST